jgi:Spy/CpxP family protein refolding chaperone
MCFSGLILMSGLAFVGCATQSAEGPGTTNTGTDAAAANGSAGDDEASTSLEEYHRHHHAGGVPSFIALSLDTLGAEPEKKAQIEKLDADLHQKMAPARDAEKNLMQVLADGVAAGQVDTAKVDAAVAQVTSTSTAAHDAVADSLNQLHAILSPAERAALVEKVQAHWEVWRHVNHEAQPGGREPGGRLAALTEELSLTPDQVEKISTGLGKPAEHPEHFDPKDAESHVQAFATAFAADTFDAKTLSTGPAANGALSSHGATRMVHFYETVTPILTADQRTKLAEHLREHMDHSKSNSGT